MVYNGKMYQLDRPAFQAWVDDIYPADTWPEKVTDLVCVIEGRPAAITPTNSTKVCEQGRHVTLMSNGEVVYIKRAHLLEIPEELQDSARAMFELQNDK